MESQDGDSSRIKRHDDVYNQRWYNSSFGWQTTDARDRKLSPFAEKETLLTGVWRSLGDPDRSIEASPTLTRIGTVEPQQYSSFFSNGLAMESMGESSTADQRTNFGELLTTVTESLSREYEDLNVAIALSLVDDGRGVGESDLSTFADQKDFENTDAMEIHNEEMTVEDMEVDTGQ